MAIACSTAAFTNAPLDEALQGIEAMGFGDVDILLIEGWCHVQPSELVRDFDGVAGHVGSLLGQHRLTPIAVNTGVGPLLHDRGAEACARRDAENGAILRFMQRFGVSVAAVQPRTPDPARPRAEVLADTARTVQEMIDQARDFSATFAFECHSGSILEALDEIREMTRLVPDVRFAYDPSHFVMNRIPLEATVPVMERAAHVHLRNAAPSAMQARFREGTVDFDRVFSLLAAAGYRGGYSIEYLAQEGVDLREDILALRGVIAAHRPPAGPSEP